jgi:hypothetical protein
MWGKREGKILKIASGGKAPTFNGKYGDELYELVVNQPKIE